jgi:hypothetical protein
VGLLVRVSVLVDRGLNVSVAELPLNEVEAASHDEVKEQSPKKRCELGNPSGDNPCREDR